MAGHWSGNFSVLLEPTGLPQQSAAIFRTTVWLGMLSSSISVQDLLFAEK